MPADRLKPGAAMRWAGTLAAIGALVVVVFLLSRDRPVDSRKAVPSLTTFQQQLAPGQLAGWNLLFVTFDTLRADHLGCYGYAPAQTPTVDGLAAKGVLFEHAVTPAPSTLPAHCTMMTGLEVPHHGVRTNGHFALTEDRVTLAEVLKDSGYATAAFVATFVLDGRFGLAQGFDTYIGIDIRRDEKRKHQAQPRLADRQTDDAVAFLTAHFTNRGEQPFFLWTHYFDPHLPYSPPGEFGKQFAETPYDGEIAYADAQLKRLLEFLEGRNKLDRTLIVFTSDHGEGLWEHGEKDHSRLIYDTTMHVPLIITCPPLYDAPSRVDDVTVGLIDVMPTLLSLLGITADLKMDGLNLLTASIPGDRAIYIETLAPMQYHAWASLHGLRRIDEKYIEAPYPEYFDLARDPKELHNLYGTDPDRYADLVKLLAERMAQWPSADEVIRPSERLSRMARQNLAALGYVSTVNEERPDPDIRLDPKDMVPVWEDLRKKDPQALWTKSMTLSLPAEADAGARRRALILARYAIRRAPEDPNCLMALGAAQYRAGEYEDAIMNLALAAKELRKTGQPVSPVIPAFRAMAEHKSGWHQEARERLRALRGPAKGKADTSNEHVDSLLSEANSLINPR